MKSIADLVRKLIPDNSPDRFKMVYLVLAFFCLVFILSISIFVIRGMSDKHLAYGVEVNSEKIVDVLYYTEVEAISINEENGKPNLAVDKSFFNALDARIKDVFDQLEIMKIVIYDSRKQVIYSTDKQSIGAYDLSNDALGRALKGYKQSVLRTNQGIVDLVGEKRVNVDVAEVCIPIRHKDGQVAGAISIFSDVSNQKGFYRQQLISSVIGLSSAIMLISLMSYAVIIKASAELKGAYGLLEKLATTDALTEVYNRREVMRRAEEHFSLMQRSREKQPQGVGLGLVMIDIDHFKTVNDTYGHLVGDIVLRDVTRRIGGVLRPYDVLGRYGGEEFLILLPNISLEEASNIGSRLLESVRELPLHAGELSIGITTSIGVTWTDAIKESLDSAVSRADELLYEAKHRGRDQMVCRV